MSEGMKPDGPDNHPLMAVLYDFENPWGQADEFFLAVVNRRRASRVLDLGCGTGTATIALARAGHTVVGVDPNPAFIDAARSKPSGELVTWICGTSADIPPGQFDTAVMMGHVAQAFVDDDEWFAVLACLKRALAPGGTLAFDSRDPDCRGWEAWEGSWAGELPGHGPVESSARVTRVAGDVVTFEVDTCLPGGERRRGVSEYRFRSRILLMESVQGAGFEVETVQGGWRGEAVAEGCGEIVIVARA
jgi:SAM-dependent methyltransferase